MNKAINILFLLLLGNLGFTSDSQHLDLGIKVSPQLYSGKQPSGEAFFKLLNKHNFKYIISVDSTKPEIDLAKKYNLTYLHIPIGYHGLENDQLKSLAKIARDLQEKTYIHCHHGKHRGPTAAAIIALERNIFTIQKALQFLKQSGTSKDYTGLWDTINYFIKYKGDLSHHVIDEVSEISFTAESMTRVDEYFDFIKSLPNDHKLISKPEKKKLENTSLLLFEEFVELERRHNDEPSSKAFLTSKKLSRELYDIVHHGSFKNFATQVSILKKDCKSCHQQYRD